MNIVYVISQVAGFIAFILSLIAYHRKKKSKIFQTMMVANVLDIFAIEPTSKKSVFLKLPKRYDLDELLCVRFERTIDNAGVFSINNSKFQLMDKSLPPKTKVQIYLSKKIGMRVKAHNKVYDVQPLEIISKGTIDNNSLDYHLWLPDVVIQLIDEYYLKDAKAS